MEKTGHTSIDDLTIAGQELAEEHLPLVTGGRRAATKEATANATYNNGGADVTVDGKLDW